MEDFATRTYGTSGLDNRPLFGETSAKDRIINLVVGSLTSLLILVTLISAFVFPQLPPKPLNIFFAVCISLSSITACILVSIFNNLNNVLEGLMLRCLGQKFSELWVYTKGSLIVSPFSPSKYVRILNEFLLFS
uniref:transmembrane protein 243 isoform X1 n=1 Tax=Callithrix jacchus TaxID=9483 RepID=UPI0004F07188|nr:transmembrane protein 243 isoform X1 [Callithrix jacchus]XP_009000791.1 transmembrane protein 243 isoform X1 [Callithrix jacchus]XP_009000792.1 transmembrane protein 243 isoform X1 [Callithrix jacchus]XP_017830882.1 transmembrane protein 243 isoform X1 [Callithrix jacchus]XP_035109832.1 transmembrane protein 243 isoform X1 [Callithrix jacchus]XP_035109833.1 transmembrane protein 243 isoform X1 [Callithrix jacchus]